MKAILEEEQYALNYFEKIYFHERAMISKGT